MLEEECGCLPVLDTRDYVVGMLTDRDICNAVGVRHESPWKIPVRAVMQKRIFTVAPEDSVDTALAVMKEHRIRRVPVVDRNGMLRGLLSLDDLARNTGLAKGRLPAEAVIDVLRHICTKTPAPAELITA
jgi:CBS domain-containing protein